MKNWKHLTRIILFMFASIMVYAGDRQGPGYWEVSAEYLYLFPMISQSYYAQSSTEPTDSIHESALRYNHDLDFHSAYRLKGNYTFCNSLNTAQLVWTHLPQFSHIASVSGVIRPIQGWANIQFFFSIFSDSNKKGKKIFNKKVIL